MKKNIMFVTTEMFPLAKVGGLADVVGALPKVLSSRGFDVRVVLPLYTRVREAAKKKGIEIYPLGKTVYMAINWQVTSAVLHECLCDGVKVWLLENDELFDRPNIYGPGAKDYEDNNIRFAALSFGALEAALQMDWIPDVFHCHDWPTALLPIALRWHYHYASYPEFESAKIIFTIHNMAHQGLYPMESLIQWGLDPTCFSMAGVEYYGRVNLLKGALFSSSRITTVSPKYAEEVATSEYGHGLDGALRTLGSRVVGILNGVDYSEYDPASDSALPKPYSSLDIAGKALCKQSLQKEMGLNVSPDAPVIGMISRLVEQKGIDLIFPVIDELCSRGVQFAILGSGSENYERLLEEAARNHPGSFSLRLGFDDDLARRIYASSDMCLVPSRFEPCGISQLIAMRYGSIPVVRSVGGLADTVVDYSAGEGGNGFAFVEYESRGLLDAISRALTVFSDKDAWNALVRKCMEMDFSWERSGDSYADLYRSLFH